MYILHSAKLEGAYVQPAVQKDVKISVPGISVTQVAEIISKYGAGALNQLATAGTPGTTPAQMAEAIAKFGLGNLLHPGTGEED